MSNHQSSARRRHRGGAGRPAFISMATACLVLPLSACGSDGAVAADDPAATSSDAEEPPGGDAAEEVLDRSSALTVATAFWAALEADDTDGVMALVDPGSRYLFELSPFGRAHTLEGQLDWYRAVGWEWRFDTCRSLDDGPAEDGDEQVVCSAAASNAWTRALGVEPVAGEWVVEVNDDGVARNLPHDDFRDRWGSSAFGPFAGWVQDNHPDDAAVMFAFDDDVDDEMLALFERNTERFVTAQQA